MPTSMPASGWRARRCATAASVLRKSPSPAPPVVSKSRPSAPTSSMPSPTKTKSLVACSIASAMAARAAAISPRGSSSNQLATGPSGARVEGQVGLRAVLDRRREHELRVLHDLLLERQDRLDRLVGVLDVPELEDVLAQALLALEQVEDVGAGHLRAAAVARKDDLLADVHGREGGARGVDVEDVVDLVGGQRLGLGLAGGQQRGLFDVGAQLAARRAAPASRHPYASGGGVHERRLRSRCPRRRGARGPPHGRLGVLTHPTHPRFAEIATMRRSPASGSIGRTPWSVRPP